uniref:Uncharacterized protein n=1 Tax=Tetranychus urticae TaxID=32264 RepID=T1KRF2_TETUR
MSLIELSTRDSNLLPRRQDYLEVSQLA